MDIITNNLYVAEHYAFEYNDDFIFLDVNALDVYLLNKFEYDFIKVFQDHISNNRLDELKKQYGERLISDKIAELLESRILKEKTYCNVPGKVSKDDLETITSIDIFLSENCNLSCKYCFVKNDRYHGKSGLMGLDVGMRSIDFLIKKSGDKKNLFVCFFGGEPLINFKLLKNIVAYAIEEGKKFCKSFHFSITTNGTLLNDEIIEFFKKHRIKVTLSIDGDGDSHDINRPLSNGESSYERIVSQLKKLEQNNITYAARATISFLTISKIARNFEHLLSLGFKRIHMENAYASGGEIFITDDNDIKRINEQYGQITNKIIEKINADEQYDIGSIPLPLGKIVNKRKVSHSCTAGRGYVAIDIHGDIYLCHRLVGENIFLLGNVIPGTFDTKLPGIILKELNVENKKICKGCWARYICGGGCYAINHEFNNDIALTPDIYCKQKKHSIKLALMVYANAALRNEQLELTNFE